MVPLAVLGGLAAAGAVGKMAGGYFQGEAAKDAARIQARAQRDIMRRQEEAYNDLAPMYDPYIERGTEAFDRMSSGVLSGEFDRPEYGKFEYDQTAMDFLDPSMQYQQQMAQKALEESAAAGGGLRSGATLGALQQQAQDYAMTDYGNAFNRMTTDKNFAYNQFNNEFDQAAARINDRYNKFKDLSNTGIQAQGNLQNLRTGTEANVAQNMANIAGYQGDVKLAGGYQAANALNAVGTGATQFAGGALQAGYFNNPTATQGSSFTPNVGPNNPYGMGTGAQVDFRARGFNPNIPNFNAPQQQVPYLGGNA